MACAAPDPRSDSLGLIQRAASIRSGIGRMDQQMQLATPSRGLDSLCTGDPRAGARFEPESVEHRLAQRRFGPLSQVLGNGQPIGLERS